MTRYGLLIDTDRCISCYACRTACQINHQLQPNESYITFEHHESGTYPTVSRHTAPHQCGHCENAPCLSVCPTGATYRAEDGTVQVDEDRCIGCGYCAQACPYGARVKLSSGVLSKCSLCEDRISQGLEPLCVKACPVSVRFFGDLDDPQSDISKAVRDLGAERLGGTLTDSNLYYAR